MLEPMRIAIVEDEKKLAESLKEGLESEGYEVDLYFDGEAAEQGIQDHAAAYSLIILDLMLPGKDGFAVCESIRAHNILIPIIVLTARDTLDDKVRVLDSGADDFLTKPFEFKELMARIRAVARRMQSNQSNGPMSHGDLVLNLKTQEATHKGKRLLLTPTEFSLLVLLIEHKDQPVSRDDIAIHLWGEKGALLSNIVDVHISNLRKKIANGHAEQTIRTIRGMGYRIEA